jgi:hypothetical protein
MSQFPAGHPVKDTDIVSRHPDVLNAIVEAVVSRLYSSDEPSTTTPGMLWINSSTLEIFERNPANDGWLFVGKYGQPYHGALPVEGGVMQGAIDMGGSPIVNVGPGVGASAARQSDLVGLIKRDASVPFDKAPFCSEGPTLSGHLTRKQYVDDQDAAGRAFNGPVSVTADPTTGDELTRKSYVDAKIASGAGLVPLQPVQINNNANAKGFQLQSDGTQTIYAKLGERPASLVEVIDSVGPAGFNVVDLSSNGVPVGAQFAILNISIEGSFKVSLRPTASHGSASYRTSPEASARLNIQAFVGVDNMKFEYSAFDAGSSGGRIRANLLGWI